MKLCPECHGIANYNSYFGMYFCENCLWEEAIPRILKRNISGIKINRKMDASKDTHIVNRQKTEGTHIIHSFT